MVFPREEEELSEQASAIIHRLEFPFFTKGFDLTTKGAEGTFSGPEGEAEDSASRYVPASSGDIGKYAVRYLLDVGVSICWCDTLSLTLTLFGAAHDAELAAACSDAQGMAGCAAAGGSTGVCTSVGGRLLINGTSFVFSGPKGCSGGSCFSFLICIKLLAGAGVFVLLVSLAAFLLVVADCSGAGSF